MKKIRSFFEWCKENEEIATYAFIFVTIIVLVICWTAYKITDSVVAAIEKNQVDPAIAEKTESNINELSSSNYRCEVAEDARKKFALHTYISNCNLHAKADDEILFQIKRGEEKVVFAKAKIQNMIDFYCNSADCFADGMIKLNFDDQIFEKTEYVPQKFQFIYQNSLNDLVQEKIVEILATNNFTLFDTLHIENINRSEVFLGQNVFYPVLMEIINNPKSTTKLIAFHAGSNKDEKKSANLDFVEAHDTIKFSGKDEFLVEINKFKKKSKATEQVFSFDDIYNKLKLADLIAQKYIFYDEDLVLPEVKSGSNLIYKVDVASCEKWKNIANAHNAYVRSCATKDACGTFWNSNYTNYYFSKLKIKYTKLPNVNFVPLFKRKEPVGVCEQETTDIFKTFNLI